MTGTVLVAELNNGMLMPAVGLGTWQLASDAKTQTVTTESLKMGYLLIDTANAYENQATLGKGIAAYKESDRVQLKPIDMEGITKFKAVDEATFLADLRKPDSDRACFVTGKVFPTGYESAQLKAQVDNYISQIGRKSADLILMHWPANMTAWETHEKMVDPKNPETRLRVWRELEDMVAEGKIRSIGVSNFFVKHLEPLIDDILKRKAAGCKKATLPVVNQIELNPLCRIPQDLAALCEKHNIHITSYSTLGSTQASVRSRKEVQEIAKAAGVTPTQAILRWALQKGWMVIPRTSNPEHAKENLEIQYCHLKDEDIKKIDALYSGTDERGCPNPADAV